TTSPGQCQDNRSYIWDLEHPVAARVSLSKAIIPASRILGNEMGRRGDSEQTDMIRSNAIIKGWGVLPTGTAGRQRLS
ncbi:hypothetical protein L0F63_004312, partial [Massospora cicadina]